MKKGERERRQRNGMLSWFFEIASRGIRTRKDTLLYTSKWNECERAQMTTFCGSVGISFINFLTENLLYGLCVIHPSHTIIMSMMNLIANYISFVLFCFARCCCFFCSSFRFVNMLLTLSRLWLNVGMSRERKTHTFNALENLSRLCVACSSCLN